MTDKPWWQTYLEGGHGGREDWPPSFATSLGLEPAGWDDADGVTLRWQPPDFTRTPGGWVQGGFLGVALDMAMTIAMFAELGEGRLPMTLEMKTPFIAGPFAQRFVVRGRTVRVGRTVGHTEGTIHDDDGKLIATSTATHIVRVGSV